jgi:Caspase domain
MGPPILALVIGINKYTSQKFRSLEGAVPDANLFEKFLKERLNVPNADIINLRDERINYFSVRVFERLPEIRKE